MGRNAQRRRIVKQVAQAERAATIRPRRTTRAHARLKLKMLDVATRAQFEQMVQTAAPDRQGALRKLLEPMLRLGLPCCGQWLLLTKLGKPIDAGQHSLYCPSRNRVVLAGG